MGKIATHSYREALINRLIKKRDIKINRILKNVRKDAKMKERDRETDRQAERERERVTERNREREREGKSKNQKDMEEIATQSQRAALII